MKRHAHDGIGGQGLRPPVSALTGLWGTLGVLLFGNGPIVWYVKTNGALNAYWRSVGAPHP